MYSNYRGTLRNLNVVPVNVVEIVMDGIKLRKKEHVILLQFKLLFVENQKSHVTIKRIILSVMRGNYLKKTLQVRIVMLLS